MKTSARYLAGFVVGAFFVAASAPAGTWDGGGLDGDTGTPGNWVGDVLPAASGADIVFAGSTNTTVNNNYFTQMNTLTFAAGAASFTLSGNALAGFPSLENIIFNNSANAQTIALNFDVGSGTTSQNTILGIGGSTTIITGNISGSNLRINRSGSGTMVVRLAGNNTLSGDITINSAARLEIWSANALGTATIRPNTSTAEWDNRTGADLHITNNFTWRGNMTFVGTHSVYSSGEFFVQSANRSVNVSANTMGVGSLNSDDTPRILTKTGNGTFQIAGAAGANPLAEFRTDAGTTLIGHRQAFGSAVLRMGSGSLGATTDLSGANAVMNTVLLAGAGTIVGDQNLTLGGSFTNFEGNRNLWNNLAVGRTLTLAGPVYLSEDAGEGRTLNLRGSGNTVISGAIADFNGSGTAGNVTVNVTGVVTLSGDNAYTGLTTITAGTAIINGDQSAATGAVTVAAGAVLGGSGTLGGATTISGSLRPGNSIGTLVVNSDVTWTGTGTEGADDWVFELGGGNVSDRLDITAGAFLKGAGSNFIFDFAGTAVPGTFTLVQWTSSADLGGGAAGTSFQLADFAYTGLDEEEFEGSFFDFSGQSLTFTVIPEPGSVGLIMGGLALLAIARRRRAL